MNTRRRDIATHCANCGADGWRSAFAWMSHEDFCPVCMDDFVKNGWAVQDKGPIHVLTESGAEKMPQHAVRGTCAWCATPIYQRWIDEGIARITEPATCRFCWGTVDAPAT